MSDNYFRSKGVAASCVKHCVCAYATSSDHKRAVPMTPQHLHLKAAPIGLPRQATSPHARRCHRVCTKNHQANQSPTYSPSCMTTPPNYKNFLEYIHEKQYFPHAGRCGTPLHRLLTCITTLTSSSPKGMPSSDTSSSTRMLRHR
jgi:hypothetical protein